MLRPDESGVDDVDKCFYVSPFLPMGGTYTMRTPLPGERLSVAITLRQDGATPFVATLTGPGRPLTTRVAARAVLRWPLLTLRTSALIRWQGIRLWLRKVPRAAASRRRHRGRARPLTPRIESYTRINGRPASIRARSSGRW